VAETDATPGAQGTPPAGANAGIDSGMIPKPRFDEVNERMKAAERRLSELSAAEEARARADLEAKGQYDKLKADYEARLTAATEKATQWDTYQATRRETLLAGLTDADKPLADGLPLDKLEALVARLGKVEAAPPPPPRPAGAPGGAVSAGALTPQEIEAGIRAGGSAWIRENAARLGM